MESQGRREYWVRLTVNGQKYRRVIIDPHFEKKHGESMNDTLILELMKRLDGKHFPAETVLDSGYKVFVNDPWLLNKTAYRLIWTTHPDKNYIGVINAFRRKYGKKKQ